MVAIYCNKWISHMYKITDYNKNHPKNNKNKQTGRRTIKQIAIKYTLKKCFPFPWRWFSRVFKLYSCQYQLEKVMSVPDLYYCYCCRHYYCHYYSSFDFLNVYYLLLTIYISFWLRVSYTTIHIISGLIIFIVAHETRRLK